MSKSTDVRYGRQGGRIVPVKKAAADKAFEEAIASGAIVHVRCSCSRWWAVPRDVGRPCHTCLTPMNPIPKGDE